MNKMIIFDMDGTLLDSSRSITKSINFVRNKLGLRAFSVKEIVKLINEPDNELPKLFYENKRPYSECRTIFEEHYIDNCIVDMDIFEGVKELLEALSNDYQMGVLTNAYGNFARKMLKHLKIDHYFKEIVGSDDIEARKPDPKGIYYFIDKYKIDKGKIFFMGDSLKDEECAKNAGIKYIFVDWGFGEMQNPDLILSKKDIINIETILQGL